MMGDWTDKLKGIVDFEGSKRDVFIYVREGKTGIETQFNPNINRLSIPHKEQIKSFLEGVIKCLK